MKTNYIQNYSNLDFIKSRSLTGRINVNLKRSVYCHAIANGDEEEWDFGWERYTKSEVASEKDMLLSALTCSKQPWLLIR